MPGLGPGIHAFGSAPAWVVVDGRARPGHDGVANAMGFSAMGVLCRDCFGSKGDRIALDVAAGVGSSDFMQYGSGNVTSARAGMQWTWK